MEWGAQRKVRNFWFLQNYNNLLKTRASLLLVARTNELQEREIPNYVFAHVLHRHEDYDNCYYDYCGVCVRAISLLKRHEEEGIGMRVRKLPQMHTSTDSQTGWESFWFLRSVKINDKVKYVNLEGRKKKERQTSDQTRDMLSHGTGHWVARKRCKSAARTRNQFYDFTATLQNKRAFIREIHCDLFFFLLLRWPCVRHGAHRPIVDTPF